MQRKKDTFIEDQIKVLKEARTKINDQLKGIKVPVLPKSEEMNSLVTDKVKIKKIKVKETGEDRVNSKNNLEKIDAEIKYLKKIRNNPAKYIQTELKNYLHDEISDFIVPNKVLETLSKKGFKVIKGEDVTYRILINNALLMEDLKESYFLLKALKSTNAAQLREEKEEKQRQTFKEEKEKPILPSQKLFIPQRSIGIERSKSIGKMSTHRQIEKTNQPMKLNFKRSDSEQVHSPRARKPTFERSMSARYNNKKSSNIVSPRNDILYSQRTSARRQKTSSDKSQVSRDQNEISTRRFYQPEVKKVRRLKKETTDEKIPSVKRTK